MGLAYADIVLTNVFDLEMAQRGLLSQSDVKRLKITAMVDSGAYMMAINESLKIN